MHDLIQVVWRASESKKRIQMFPKTRLMIANSFSISLLVQEHRQALSAVPYFQRFKL